jgi:2-hydroxy-6-oxo-6-(2'-aminophenyl)hexa-2,4-dienoate hydrolase
MEGKYITAGGIHTYYYEAGQGETVVLVHGGGAGADAWGNWKGCIPRLAQKFRVVAVDMVGFGKTEKPDPSRFEYSQSARVEHIIAFLEALGVGKVHLVGNSMGGATVLGVCMRRPELVGKAVLMGSAGLRFEMSESIRVILGAEPTREYFRKLVQVLTHEGFPIDEEMIEYRYQLMQQPGAIEAYRAITRWVAEHGLFYPEEEIRKVRHPVLIVNGREDKVIPPSMAYRMWELLENARLYLIPNCGHWAMIEYPEEFCEVVALFLGR